MKKFPVYILIFIACCCLGKKSFAQVPFENDIKAFQQQDSIAPPRQGAILFIGSSSFTDWKKVADDFPGYAIINRGFGGSTLPDVIRNVETIVYPYHPRQVVIYCGENDLASSDTVSAQTVYDRFATLFGLIRDSFPRIPITFVSLKPSPSRERLFSKMKEANGLIRKFLAAKPHTSFVDVYAKMIDKNGKPLKELFIEDDLHMNAKGYAIWQKEIKPYLLKD